MSSRRRHDKTGVASVVAARRRHGSGCGNQELRTLDQSFFCADRVNASLTFNPVLTEVEPRFQVPPSPTLPSLPTRGPFGPHAILSKALSRRALRDGDADFHDLRACWRACSGGRISERRAPSSGRNRSWSFSRLNRRTYRGARFDLRSSAGRVDPRVGSGKTLEIFRQCPGCLLLGRRCPPFVFWQDKAHLVQHGTPARCRADAGV
jgi:hypothetical protein